MSRLVKYVLRLIIIFFMIPVHAGQAYLDKFHGYLKWSSQLPTTTDPDFLSFIEFPSPLTTKLREKWLYQMAYSKRWADFHTAYRGSNDVSLQCYAQTALYNLDYKDEALKSALPLWLNGNRQPAACNTLFKLLLANNAFSVPQLQQRLTLALEKSNHALAITILKQLKLPQEADLLEQIHKKPTIISYLSPSMLHSEFYLYGLKLLFASNQQKAIELANKYKLSQYQQQDFIGHVALYKAIRHQPEAKQWLNQITSLNDHPVLLDWSIRSALSDKRWDDVLKLIQISPDAQTPCWRYWRARALQKLGDHINANQEYEVLAKTRNYYGFLASMRINHPLSFEEEQVVPRQDLLKLYQPITQEIRVLYNTNQVLAAARRLNDFMSELPNDEQSTLANWVANDLHWYDRAIYLSNTPKLNNILSLRFPIPYTDIIKISAQKNKLKPELVFAMIRQESTFRSDIISSAGAQGIMQIMPMTARMVANQTGIKYSGPDQLLNSEKSIEIGTAYLGKLSKQFNGHPILMAAAYNAGPKQVRHWITYSHTSEIDLWIETLAWPETRNYLKNILAFYAVYQHRLNEPINLTALMQEF